MESTNIILDNGVSLQVNGIFYVFDSKYYFMYTDGTLVDGDYVQLYVVQVGKEVQNTQNGPIDTGHMLGFEITDQSQWNNVQQSITKIVNDKKTGTNSDDIQYLPINTLVNLKITSKNKFKLLKTIVKENFNLSIGDGSGDNKIQDSIPPLNEVVVNQDTTIQNIVPITPVQNIVPATPDINSSDDVIIDYRSKYFEEQEKNKELVEQIKSFEERINSIKEIVNDNKE